MKKDLKNASTQQNRISILIEGYVNKNILIWIPKYIVSIIIEFHGIFDTNFESNILINNKLDMMELLYNHLNRNIKLKRIYSGINDGFSSQKYHKICDYMEHKIILIYNEYNVIFGGYTSIILNDAREGIYIKDSNAFLFQIYPNKKIFLPNDIDGSDTIYHRTQAICDFAYDLEICNECNNDKASSSQPWSFKLNKGSDLVGGRTHEISSRVDFLVKDIEAFELQFI